MLQFDGMPKIWKVHSCKLVKYQTLKSPSNKIKIKNPMPKRGQEMRDANFIVG